MSLSPRGVVNLLQVEEGNNKVLAHEEIIFVSAPN
jgi:hypothetical protein